MKNIKNNLVDLSQKEAIHIYGGTLKDSLFSEQPSAPEITAESGACFFISNWMIKNNHHKIGYLLLTKGALNLVKLTAKKFL